MDAADNPVHSWNRGDKRACSGELSFPGSCMKSVTGAYYKPGLDMLDGLYISGRHAG